MNHSICKIKILNIYKLVDMEFIIYKNKGLIVNPIVTINKN